MEQDFYDLAKKIHDENIKYIQQQSNNIDNMSKLEYAKFCVWCRAFKNADFSEENFKQYQLDEKVKLNNYIKKRISELYFDYEFEFDYNTMKWKSHKKSH